MIAENPNVKHTSTFAQISASFWATAARKWRFLQWTVPAGGPGSLMTMKILCLRQNWSSVYLPLKKIPSIWQFRWFDTSGIQCCFLKKLKKPKLGAISRDSSFGAHQTFLNFSRDFQAIDCVKKHKNWCISKIKHSQSIKESAKTDSILDPSFKGAPDQPWNSATAAVQIRMTR